MRNSRVSLPGLAPLSYHQGTFTTPVAVPPISETCPQIAKRWVFPERLMPDTSLADLSGSGNREAASVGAYASMSIISPSPSTNRGTFASIDLRGKLYSNKEAHNQLLRIHSYVRGMLSCGSGVVCSIIHIRAPAAHAQTSRLDRSTPVI